MRFLDLTGELLGKIDFAKSKIALPQKLVFVCGGEAGADPNAPKSMREVLLAKAYAVGKKGEFGGAKVLLAEEAAKALSDSHFSNLLDLEQYIAAVVQAVILIVESPGSMCELGAFVTVKEIRDKLIIVLQGKYKNTPSFITDGAIRYFASRHDNPQVPGYDWNVDNDTKVVSAPDYAINAMVAELPLAMQEVHKAHAKEKLQSKKLEHQIYLTLAFCHILRAAKLIDIKNCFEIAKIDIDEITIKRCLDTLMIVKMIDSVWQGIKLQYYVATVEANPLVPRFVPGVEPRDRHLIRWQTRINELIEDEEKFRIEMFVGHRHV